MKPNGGGQATGKVAEWLDKDFDSFEPFKKQLSAAKAAVEGSGWTLLCWSPVPKVNLPQKSGTGDKKGRAGFEGQRV